MIGKVIKIKWDKDSEGNTLHALGVVYNEKGNYYEVAINQISKNTLIPGTSLKRIDKRIIVGEATEEDIEAFKKVTKLI